MLPKIHHKWYVTFDQVVDMSMLFNDAYDCTWYGYIIQYWYNDLLYYSTQTLMYYSHPRTDEDIIMIKQRFSLSSCTYYYPNAFIMSNVCLIWQTRTNWEISHMQKTKTIVLRTLAYSHNKNERTLEREYKKLRNARI